MVVGCDVMAGRPPRRLPPPWVLCVGSSGRRWCGRCVVAVWWAGIGLRSVARWIVRGWGKALVSFVRNGAMSAPKRPWASNTMGVTE